MVLGCGEVALAGEAAPWRRPQPGPPSTMVPRGPQGQCSALEAVGSGQLRVQGTSRLRFRKWVTCLGAAGEAPRAHGLRPSRVSASACVSPQGAILTTMLATRNFSGENRRLQGGSGWPATSHPPRTPSAPWSAAGLTCLISATPGEAWAPQEAARHVPPRLSGLCVP